MKMVKAESIISLLTVLSSALALHSAQALEPQTLFNFQVTPSAVTGTLVQGPMEIFTAPVCTPGRIGTG